MFELRIKLEEGPGGLTMETFGEGLTTPMESEMLTRIEDAIKQTVDNFAASKWGSGPAQCIKDEREKRLPTAADFLRCAKAPEGN